MAKGFPNVGATVIDTVADLPAASAALEGVMVFQKDTNELKICDGSAWVSVVDTDSPPAMTLISPTSVVNATNTNGTVTFSGVSSFSLNGVFSSAYDNYLYTINCGSVGGSGSLSFLTRLRAGGVDATATNYGYVRWYWQQGGTTGVVNANAAAFWYWCQMNSAASNLSNGTGTLFRPFLAQPTAFVSGMQLYDTARQGESIIGEHSLSTSYDGITFLTNSALTFSGTVRFYGLRNSI